MTLDRALLAEKAAALERHLARLTERLPPDPDELRPGSDAADVVVLNLWQAIQIVIDVALAACLTLKQGTPSTYREAFGRLAAAGVLEAGLADRLQRAAGFRNVVVHAYGSLDMARVHEAAHLSPPTCGPASRASATTRSGADRGAGSFGPAPDEPPPPPERACSTAPG